MPFDLVTLTNVVISGVLTGLVYGLMALGLSVIFGVARVVNFAHGEIMTIAMYVTVLLFASFDLNPFLAVVPVAILFFFFGYLLQSKIIQPFITRPDHAQFMLLLAIAIVMTNATLIVFGPDARSVNLDSLLESIELGPLLIDRGKLYAALVAFGTAAALFALFRFTRTGTAIRACADNWLGAKVVGLNVQRLYAIAFGLGAACVAVAGSMLILLVDLTPALGPAYTLLAFVIVIVGGLGSMHGVLIGVSEALAGLFITPSAKSMFRLRAIDRRAADSPARSLRWQVVNRRAIFLLAALGALLLFLPSFANNYILSVATLFLFFAYTGQAWNILMGFAGQLSLGHALYLGIGAYTAAALYSHFRIGPWAGLWLAMALCVISGIGLGSLAFRFGIAGVYFTLLTIAFAEFTRIGFDHFTWVGGSGGLFLKVMQRDQIDLLNLRGTPAMFYYVMLALTAAAFMLCVWLLRSRAGYYWQAIRENEEAAQALGINTFRWKILALVISVAMTALAGVFQAFYYNNLFPDQVFNIGRSVEIMLGPIVGGIGTLFGPIVGAALLTLFADGATELVTALGWDVPGVKQLIYGIGLFLIVVFLPHGIWPRLARKLRVSP